MLVRRQYNSIKVAGHFVCDEDQANCCQIEDSIRFDLETTPNRSKGKILRADGRADADLIARQEQGLPNKKSRCFVYNITLFESNAPSRTEGLIDIVG